MSTANGTTSVADDSRIGVTVLSAFSAVWAVALLGLSAAPTAPAAVFTSFIVVAVAVVVLVMRRHGLRQVELRASPLSAQGRSRVFLVTNVVQAVLFSVAISICIATDNITVLPLVGSVVVGGHFLPLAWAFADRTFGVVGAVMLVVGAACWALSASPDVTAAAAAVPVCAVNAVLLLVTAARQVRWRPRADSAV